MGATGIVMEEMEVEDGKVTAPRLVSSLTPAEAGH